MSRLARDGMAEPVSRDQILRRVRGQGNIHFRCSADHKQDWQPHPVDLYSAISDDHTYTYIRTYIHTYIPPGEENCVVVFCSWSFCSLLSILLNLAIFGTTKK